MLRQYLRIILLPSLTKFHTLRNEWLTLAKEYHSLPMTNRENFMHNFTYFLQLEVGACTKLHSLLSTKKHPIYVKSVSASIMSHRTLKLLTWIMNRQAINQAFKHVDKLSVDFMEELRFWANYLVVVCVRKLKLGRDIRHKVLQKTLIFSSS